jgi:alkyl sulfatase BDS1-like metallo-beta-lactamase superfamily hydrolase
LRQSKLNNNYGLYEVIPGIHQVRGLDLSDISFVRGKTGWIVFDPLVTTEVVRVAWNLFQDHVGEGLPVSAVIYSHTHGDHWGGVRGIVDEADVRSGYVGQGLGQAVSAGATGLIAPTKYIEKASRNSRSTASGWCFRTRRTPKLRGK